METVYEVLIVEDDLVLCQQIAQLVPLWGYRALTATDGEQALKLLEANSPQIVLVDLMLPIRNGLHILEFAHERYPHLPILVMTAHASLESALAALKQGAYDYLLKPITPAELEAALRRACNAVELHRAHEREIQLRQVAALSLTLAHEINNPLAMIMGELQLQLEVGTPLDTRGLNICLEAARRIAATISTLAELTEVTYEQYAGLELLHLQSRD